MHKAGWLAAVMVAGTARGAGMEALMAPDGTVRLTEKGRPVATIAPGTAAAEWTGLPVRETRRLGGERRGTLLFLDHGGTVTIEASAEQHGQSVRLAYRVATTVSLSMESVHVSLNTAAAPWAGAPFILGSTRGRVPAQESGVVVASGKADLFSMGPAASPAGLVFTLRHATPKPVLLQDSRRWGPNLEIRLGADREGPAPWIWEAGKAYDFKFTLSANRAIAFAYDAPVTIRAGSGWIPLKPNPEVEPGSALDVTGWNLTRSPAGALGWLRASTSRPGALEFEGEPGRPVRFVGVNLGTGALFPTPEEAEKLAARLARRGITSVRVHHYEMAPWVRDQGFLDPQAPDTRTLHPGRMARFDALFAALKRHGIYVTTDLYVSRPVKANEVYPGAEGELDYAFKHLLCVEPRALENWKAYARVLLNHVNPHTGLAYKDDPVLAWLVLVNEGNMGNDPNELRRDPREAALWDAAFAAWKKERGFPAAEWGGAECRRFLWERHRATQRAQIAFLRDELKCKAMLSDLNGWTDEWGAQVCRAGFDYVDNHMYWDHPHFLEKSWSLPSRGGSGGGSAIAEGGAGLHLALTRLVDRPFTVSEFHFVPPNPFRAESGLLYGAYAALQDWSVLWRFAYSGDAKQTFAPGPVGFFDVVNDPITQAAEYATVALFARGDLAPAAHELVVAGTEADFLARGGERIGGALGSLGWCARVGSLVGAAADGPGRTALTLGAAAGATALSDALGRLRAAGALPAANATDPGKGIWEAADGSVRVDVNAGVLAVATARTAGAAGPEGTAVTAGPLTVKLGGSWGAVWVTSLDGHPLAESGRMLVVHATDVKNTGDKFRDRGRTVLEAWGALPYLVCAGTASIKLARPDARKLKVWRLSLAGKRLARVTPREAKGALSFTASTATTPEATLYYEISAGK